MNQETKEQLIAILSNYETRSNKDIRFLMEQAFKAGQGKKYLTFQSWFEYIKRELLEL
ncbi:MAG TPA: hypothetical protein VD884_13340 [Ohtaekwangia sp.]|nr:hypothetical protein [Ohtaekwangia sp.]